MAVDVRCEIEIERPRAEVSAFAGDLDNTTLWYEHIDAVAWRWRRRGCLPRAFQARVLCYGRRR